MQEVPFKKYPDAHALHTISEVEQVVHAILHGSHI